MLSVLGRDSGSVIGGGGGAQGIREQLHYAVEGDGVEINCEVTGKPARVVCSCQGCGQVQCCLLFTTIIVVIFIIMFIIIILLFIIIY